MRTWLVDRHEHLPVESHVARADHASLGWDARLGKFSPTVITPPGSVVSESGGASGPGYFPEPSSIPVTAHRSPVELGCASTTTARRRCDRGASRPRKPDAKWLAGLR